MSQPQVFSEQQKEFSFIFNDIVNDTITANIYQILMKRDDNFFSINRPMMFEYFAVAFKHDTVFYWGFLDDYKRSDNPVLQKLGEKICDKIIEIKD